MSRFVQLHLLTSYPPSCLNRDDLGRPKTAVMGGSTRLRISSQSLKRAWRTSDVFREALSGHIGIRTKEMGRHVYHAMVSGVPLKAALEGSAASDSGDVRRPRVEAKAREWAKTIAGVFGESKGDNKDDPLQALEIKQLAHFSPEEVDALDRLIAKVAESGEAPTAEDLQLLRKPLGAADIALFGRMLASAPAYNVEAAAQVAHALSVHRVTVEDDFFTAVDDLNTGEEDIGAGHMGETEFAAGLFYLYVCIDRELLRENLGGDAALANRALGALVEAAAVVAPTGKQNSFASRARASYLLAEKGDQQPRSLSVAFLGPVQANERMGDDGDRAEDMLEAAIARIEATSAKMDRVYGDCANGRLSMNARTGSGSLRNIIGFVTE